MDTDRYLFSPSRAARISRCISFEAVHHAERVRLKFPCRIQCWSLDLCWTTVHETIKAGTQIEKLLPQKTHLSVCFYDRSCVGRCFGANRGNCLSLKIAYAEGNYQAPLGCYHASRILAIDRAPQKLHVQTLQELSRGVWRVKNRVLVYLRLIQSNAMSLYYSPRNQLTSFRIMESHSWYSKQIEFDKTAHRSDTVIVQ